MNPERIPSGWNKIRSPAGDCVTLTSYREYVCRELLDYLHCGIDELVDKIVERNMVGKTTAKRKG
jgi:hypothetical protein